MEAQFDDVRILAATSLEPAATTSLGEYMRGNLDVTVASVVQAFGLKGVCDGTMMVIIRDAADVQNSGVGNAAWAKIQSARL